MDILVFGHGRITLLSCISSLVVHTPLDMAEWRRPVWQKFHIRQGQQEIYEMSLDPHGLF